ncbi:Hypothetical_protein [Hexamita inflata]|uniref:Hypothetical_protein n=1 Tax=Hexamita inflata TaxID=28002 RepID=A0AA86R1J4_9EUKA|nr:Hypothetical protein HINF_LOCUS57666 [Hexamita inflata]
MKVESLIRIKRVLWTRHTENIETWAHQPILHRAVSVQIDSCGSVSSIVGYLQAKTHHQFNWGKYFMRWAEPQFKQYIVLIVEFVSMILVFSQICPNFMVLKIQLMNTTNTYQTMCNRYVTVFSPQLFWFAPLQSWSKMKVTETAPEECLRVILQISSASGLSIWIQILPFVFSFLQISCINGMNQRTKKHRGVWIVCRICCRFRVRSALIL